MQAADYSFPSLTPRTYNLKVEKPGFKSNEAKGLLVIPLMPNATTLSPLSGTGRFAGRAEIAPRKSILVAGQRTMVDT
ncbi:MAG: hypothetical protein QOJ99_1265 [Bryobacterales bacterium]|jgi:hypothetical protein|nr:hypothetical protein [Bryobacterales bacterium]